LKSPAQTGVVTKVVVEILRLDRGDQPACVDQNGHVHMIVGEEPP
jgi:hypothetical protein